MINRKPPCRLTSGIKRDLIIGKPAGPDAMITKTAVLGLGLALSGEFMRHATNKAPEVRKPEPIERATGFTVGHAAVHANVLSCIGGMAHVATGGTRGSDRRGAVGDRNQESG